jgi:ATP-dependent DNA helicase DinG
MSEQSQYDPQEVAALRALGAERLGIPLLSAHITRTGGEHRKAQEEMFVAVDDAIEAQTHLAVQAGTGTGKSYAYLLPIADTDGRTVIATATNQLSEQLVSHDLPEVQQTLRETGGDVEFALLKGRANYLCLAKFAHLRSLANEPNEQIGTKKTARERAAADLYAWAEDTDTGDRSEAPPVRDDIWAAYSSTSTECPGASRCAFASDCFTEKARATARKADIVVTNHALVAQSFHTNEEDDTDNDGPIFGPVDRLVIDEAHDWADALTSALSKQVTPQRLIQRLDAARISLELGHDNDPDVLVDAAVETWNDLSTMLRDCPINEAIDTWPQGFAEFVRLASISTRKVIHALERIEEKHTDGPDIDRLRRVLADLISGIATAEAAVNAGDDYAVWLAEAADEEAVTLHVAPIQVGDLFAEKVTDQQVTLTSATLALAGDFTPFLRRLGLDSNATTLDVGSPYHYAQQGMLYIPQAPFPEPVGAERTEHRAAVLDETVRLVTAAGGRTLALFTTKRGAEEAATRLREELPGLTILNQGEKPAKRLVEEFIAEETSVLCATMGLWQGISAEGPTCSLVIIDKLAFAPPSDVLMQAQKQRATQAGRDAFTEIMVAGVTMKAAQAAGRLIRTSTDRGVVAILDPRLLSKRYGSLVIKSLPPFNVYTDGFQVEQALKRLTGGTPDNARAENQPSQPQRRKKTQQRNRSRSHRRSPSGKRIPRRKPTNS